MLLSTAGRLPAVSTLVSGGYFGAAQRSRSAVKGELREPAVRRSVKLDAFTRLYRL